MNLGLARLPLPSLVEEVEGVEEMVEMVEMVEEMEGKELCARLVRRGPLRQRVG